MAHRYDAATKYLVENRLPDWLPLTGRTTTAPLEIVNADLSTVTAAADRVLRVNENPTWLLHLELQSSRDPDLIANLQVYNALLGRRHGELVRTLVVLLRRSADWPEMSGVVERAFPGEPPYLAFRYQVVRVWQLPAETLLSGGLALVSLAPLGDVAEADLPAVIGRMEQRIGREATPQEAGVLWTAADVLMGLRYPRPLVNDLLRGIHNMKDSVTYQGIVEEGVVKGQRDALLLIGRRKFGTPPSEATQAAVAGINDPDRLADLINRVFDVASWEELLAAP